MTARRAGPPRKRPHSSTAIDAAAARVREANTPDQLVNSYESGAAGSEFDAEALRKTIIEDFEASLRAQPDLDQEGLDFALANFKQAVMTTPLHAQVIPGEGGEAWEQMLNGMVDDGLLSETDRNDLARLYRSAIEVLDAPGTQFAIEFANRVRADGEAKAVAWLREQQSAQGDNSSAQASKSRDYGDVPLDKGSILQSRSRRLRGPPTS